jgi:hypothetical protein
MAKIEGQLLDNNAVKIFKKSMQTQDLTNVIKSTLNQSPQTSLLCAHTLNKLTHITVFLVFCQRILIALNEDCL